MKVSLRLGAILTSALLLNAGCRNTPKTNDADAEAVFTANTSIKNQGQIAFCWAYTAVAMIEADYKKRTGREIDLSEEAIGFFHFAEQLKANMDFNLANKQNLFDVQGAGYVSKASTQVGSKSAFTLIERWGLMPESQWSEKFDGSVNSAMASIKSEFDALQKQIQGKQTWFN